MTGDEFFNSVKDGDRVKMNTELWFGLGFKKGKEILLKDQQLTVDWKHVGFFDYFIHATTDDGRKYRLKIQSLDLV